MYMVFGCKPSGVRLSVPVILGICKQSAVCSNEIHLEVQKGRAVYLGFLSGSRAGWAKGKAQLACNTSDSLFIRQLTGRGTECPARVSQ
jgi:hypothetical protein